jgi:hypothetical protein
MNAMSSERTATLFIVILAICGLATQQPTGRGDEFDITLSAPTVVDNVEGLFRYALRVTSRKAGQTTEFIWRTRVSDVDGLRVVNHLAVLFGRVGTSSKAVAVVDLRDGREMALVLCRHPVVSSDGRRLAFLQFVPRHAPQELRKDLLLVMDLEHPTSNVLGDDADASWVTMASSHGVVVYPFDSRGTPYDARHGFSAPARERIVSPVLWTDLRRLAFATSDGARNRVIFLDVTDLTRPESVSTVDITGLFLDEARASAAEQLAAVEKLRVVSLELQERELVIVIGADATFARTIARISVP